MSAISLLLDRGYGKTPQDVDLNVLPDSRLMTDEEIDAELLRLAAKVVRTPAEE